MEAWTSQTKGTLGQEKILLELQQRESVAAHNWVFQQSSWVRNIDVEGDIEWARDYVPGAEKSWGNLQQDSSDLKLGVVSGCRRVHQNDQKNHQTLIFLISLTAGCDGRKSVEESQKTDVSYTGMTIESQIILLLLDEVHYARRVEAARLL